MRNVASKESKEIVKCPGLLLASVYSNIFHCQSMPKPQMSTLLMRVFTIEKVISQYRSTSYLKHLPPGQNWHETSAVEVAPICFKPPKDFETNNMTLNMVDYHTNLPLFFFFFLKFRLFDIKIFPYIMIFFLHDRFGNDMCWVKWNCILNSS